jgi:glutamine amidotransferase
MFVAVAYFGMSNTGSVSAALEEAGVEHFVTSDPSRLAEASHIILPGVGSFSLAMQRLRDGGWLAPLRDSALAHKKPILGICLGMQLLASSGEEGGACEGLNLIEGRVRRLDTFGCTLRIPHVGWNSVHHRSQAGLFDGIAQGTDFYFVHSYAFEPHVSGDVAATVDYGVPLTAAVRRANIFGAQFHPEKSSKAGRKVLKNFLECA